MMNTRINIYSKLFTTVLFAMFSCKLFAYDFMVDGICYNYRYGEENAVEVTYKDSYYIYNGNSGYKGQITIPEKVIYNDHVYTITSIGNYAFYNCKELTGTLTIPPTVTHIGIRAFYNCRSLSGSLIIPNSVKSIEEYAFCDCSGFSGSLTLSNSLSKIGKSVFSHMIGLKGVLVIPNSVKSIEEYAFSSCSGFSGSLTIPNSVTSIEKGAFYGCRGFSGSLTIPNTVTEIGEDAFRDCSGFSGPLLLPNSLNTICACSFAGCSSFSGVLSIPQTVTSIEHYAFEKCSGFTGSLTIPNSVKKIGEYAFFGCNGFITLNIPNSIASIGEGAFNGCNNIGVVQSSIDSPFEISDNTFKSISPNAVLQVPQGTINKYKALSGWSSNFEEIVEYPNISTTYKMTITSSENGYVTFAGTTTNNGKPNKYTVNEGTSATLTFTPNSGYKVGSLKVNNADVTSYINNNTYTISNINKDITVEVTFEQINVSLTYNGVNYRITSSDKGTVNVASGSYGQSLKVPPAFYVDGKTWQVKGMDSDVLTSNPQLAAVIWEAFVKFDASPNNPNFLLYVTSADYAPSTIKNVIVNGTANSITLTETTSGNDFYCPEAFTAQSISYTHNYMMTTGIGESLGWETIALPFDVQTIIHSTKGEIIPFAKWNNGDSRRPFWLYELTSSGWREASAINAYTPYIISMPNNDKYYDEARLNGNVTFSATNVKVEPTSVKTANYQGKTFTPNFTTTSASASIYALNVKNQWTQNTNSQKDGSTFVQNLRTLHPFEAYMSSENSTRSSFPIFEDMTTGIRGITDLIYMKRTKGVYNLKGQKVKVEVGGNLPAGIYIINGQKVIVK